MNDAILKSDVLPQFQDLCYAFDNRLLILHSDTAVGTEAYFRIKNAEINLWISFA